jgi:hypothetical protein
MGDISPSKMPGAKKKARRDDTDFTQFAEGGLTPLGKAGEKATSSIGQREHAEDYYKKEAAKAVKEIKPPVPGKKKGGEVWDKPRPKDLGKSKKLSPAKKKSAKAAAKAAGRPYPNLIDNMRMARK